MFDLYQNVLFTCILSTTLPGSNGNEDNDNLILLSHLRWVVLRFRLHSYLSICMSHSLLPSLLLYKVSVLCIYAIKHVQIMTCKSWHLLMYSFYPQIKYIAKCAL